MNVFIFPWLEMAICAAMIGSPIVGRFRDPNRAFRWGLSFTAAAFGCAVMACLDYYVGTPAEIASQWSIQPYLFGGRRIALDELSAPLVPAVALLHLLTSLATARAHMRRYSSSWSLTAMAIRLAMFSCHDPWTLIGLLTVSTLPPYVELRNRRRRTRVYFIHTAIYLSLLIGGWALVQWSHPATWWTTIPLALAILVRCGVVPAHCWITDWFEHASMGIALLFAIPLGGVYAAIRLLLPIAPSGVLWGVALVALVSALYSAAMAATQRETRRFFAFLLLSHASLVVTGAMLHSQVSLTGSLCLWFSIIISLGGFGLTLRAVESRFGRLSLVKYHGLYDHTPGLAALFLITGLAGVGFPLTLGFISTELLIDGAMEANPLIAVAVAGVTTLNGIAVLRAYLLLFTGTRHVSSVSLRIGLRERIAILTMSALIFGGGLFPQPGVITFSNVAERLLHHRYTDKWPTAISRPPAFSPILSLPLPPTAY